MLRVKNEICYQKSPQDQEMACTENFAIYPRFLMNQYFEYDMYIDLHYIDFSHIRDTLQNPFGMDIHFERINQD